MKKVVYGGRVWCSVADAARYLHTTPQKIREMMGADKLRYTQIRKNGNLYVLTEDLVAARYPKPAPSGT